MTATVQFLLMYFGQEIIKFLNLHVDTREMNTLQKKSKNTALY